MPDSSSSNDLQRALQQIAKDLVDLRSAVQASEQRTQEFVRSAIQASEQHMQEFVRDAVQNSELQLTKLVRDRNQSTECVLPLSGTRENSVPAANGR